MGATFTDIVKTQREQGAGVFSSLGKAAGQRTLERIDPRNYLFSRTGLISALFPSVKGYQAKGAKDVSTLKSSSTSLSSGQTDLIVNKLDELRVEQRITSKNSLMLPLIARDMNIMRQNILKLVKLSGGKPSSRADSFFLSAKQREEQIESKFGKKVTSPTAVTSKGDKEEKSGGLGSILSGLKVIGGALLSAYLLSSKFREMVNGLLNSLFESILGPENWGAIKKSISDSIQGIKESIMKSAGIDPQKIDKTMEVVKQGGKAAAVTAGALLANKYIKPIGESATTSGIKTKEFGKKTKRVATNIEKSALKGQLTTIFNKIAKKPSMWKAFLSALAQKFGITTILKLGALGIIATGAAATGVGMVVSWLIISVNYLTLLEILKFAYDWYNLNKGEDDTSPSPVDKSTSNQIGREADTSDTTPVDKSTSNQIGREADTSDTTPSMLTSKPSSINEESGDVSFNQLSKGEQDSLLDAQARQEGFFKKGSIANRLNNPGNITYTETNKNSEWVGKLGGVAGDTVKGPDGKTRTFVKYPTPEAGRAAQRKLWENVYGSKPIGDALAKWVDPSDSTSFNNYTKDVYASINRTPQTGMTLASSVPSINDIGKFLNEGSVEFESLIREFLKSTGEVTINSDSSTKVSTTNASQDGPPGSAYDTDMFTAMVDSAVNY